MNNEKVFIGVSWPYSNGDLHLGHISGTYLACDFFARYKRANGADVLMVSGSDTHGTPITVAAQKEGITPKEIVDKYHPKNVRIFNELGITFDLYTNTRTQNHKEVVQEELLILLDNGHLYEEESEQLYDPTEKVFLPDRYVEGECPHCGFMDARGDQCDDCGKLLEPEDLINPTSKLSGVTPVLKKTKHLYFDLHKLESKLKEYIDAQDHWRPQVKAFTSNWIKEGLHSRAFTRDMSDGIPVPIDRLPEGFDPKTYAHKVIYVWFEAVTGYLSAAVEWDKLNQKQEELSEGTDGQSVIFRKGVEGTTWEDYWKDSDCKHYYFIGKDNIPFHSIIWPALLIAREDGLNLPYDIISSQYLTLEGKQFSKSRGWSISVDHIISRYGVDPVRYFFAIGYPENKDIDFSWKQFQERVNNELVANIGNFIHRTLTFTHKNFDAKVPEGKIENQVQQKIDEAFEKVGAALEKSKFAIAMAAVLELGKYGNQYFNEKEPWVINKENPEKAGVIMYNSIQIISAIKTLIYPFMPHASERLGKLLNLETVDISWGFVDISAGTEINTPTLLFQKIEDEQIEEEYELLKAK